MFNNVDYCIFLIVESSLILDADKTKKRSGQYLDSLKAQNYKNLKRYITHTIKWTDINLDSGLDMKYEQKPKQCADYRELYKILTKTYFL